MPIFPIPHFEWQVLRTVLRNGAPTRGRELRLIPTRRTKDGEFLNQLVERGLLQRVSGTAATPFEATYSLTEKGEHAAEYGECEMSITDRVTQPPSTRTASKKAKSGRNARRVSR